MKQSCYHLLSLIVTSFMLCACQAMLPNHIRSPYCNQLNSQIVFTGATSNTRQQEIENAQQPLQQSNYDESCTKR